MKKIFIVCLLLTVACLLGACQRSPYEPPPQTPSDTPASTPSEKTVGDVSSFYFSERSSYNRRVQGYEFKNDEGKHTVSFWLANEDEPYSVDADQAWADTLKGLIAEYDLLTWDGFQASDSMLMDGKTFQVDFTLSDGTTVHAGGYGKFPPGYGDASNAIESHFLKLLPQDLQDWT